MATVDKYFFDVDDKVAFCPAVTVSSVNHIKSSVQKVLFVPWAIFVGPVFSVG